MRKITLDKIINEDNEIVWQARRMGKPFRLGDIVKFSSCGHESTYIMVPGGNCLRCALGPDPYIEREERLICPHYKDDSLLCMHEVKDRDMMFMSADNILEGL